MKKFAVYKVQSVAAPSEKEDFRRKYLQKNTHKLHIKVITEVV